MRSQGLVKEEKVFPCLDCKKRTVYVKLADDKFHCLPCAQKKIAKENKES